MSADAPHILLIFDIDGTLTYSDGATSRAFKRAFARLIGISAVPDVRLPAGKTDPQIFREMLDSAGIRAYDFPILFAGFKDLFLPIVREELGKATGARLLPGVRELLTTLSLDPRFALALGTGNIEDSAMEKLRIHDVDHFFQVGGFGSDSEDRSQVLQIAIQRSEQHWKTHFLLSDIWVIGDTPRDIGAGKSIGAGTIAVASGAYPKEDLIDANPDAVLDSLEEQRIFIDTILNSRKS